VSPRNASVYVLRFICRRLGKHSYRPLSSFSFWAASNAWNANYSYRCSRCLSVCQSVCLPRGLNRRRRVQCTPRAVCAGSFGAAFAECLWLLAYCLSVCLSVCLWFVFSLSIVGYGQSSGVGDSYLRYFYWSMLRNSQSKKNSCFMLAYDCVCARGSPYSLNTDTGPTVGHVSKQMIIYPRSTFTKPFIYVLPVTCLNSPV